MFTPVTAADIVDFAANLQPAVTLVEADVQTELDLVDQDAILATEEAKFTHEIWDKTSPINGVPAATVLANRKDIPAGGEVYLIKDAATGRVVYFQPHQPGVEGLQAMDSETVGTHAEDHCHGICCDNARMEVIRTVMIALGHTV